MRNATEDSVEGFFAGDLPYGGTLIECQLCKEKTESYESFYEPLLCNGCGKELHYPEGASW